MPTMIPPTVFTQITQTNSSPEITAALLNEAESSYSTTRKHFNAKRLYPFWRPCPLCKQPFAVENSDEYHKRKYCSPECGRQALSQQAQSRDQTHKRKGQVITCWVCGVQVYKPAAWLRKVQGKPTCGNVCRGVARSRNTEIRAHLKRISASGRSGWTERSRESYQRNMSGPNNPAWKGGVTYFKTHGNYAGVKYVRCPADYTSMARKDGYVMEHRLLVAQAIGRSLLRSEVVHHINHDPTDNRIENLQLFASNRDHKLYEHHGSPPPIWP